MTFRPRAVGRSGRPSSLRLVHPTDVRNRDGPEDPARAGGRRAGRPVPHGHAGSRQALDPVRSGGGITRPLKTSEAVARDVVHDIIADRARTRVTGCRPKRRCSSTTRSAGNRSGGTAPLRGPGPDHIRRGPGGGPMVGTVDPANLGRISSLYYHLAGATYRELFEAWVSPSRCWPTGRPAIPTRRCARPMEPFLGDDGRRGNLADYVEEHASSTPRSAPSPRTACSSCRCSRWDSS